MPLTVTELLGPDGPIAARMRRALGSSAYESRPEQVRMGEEVARTLESRGRLLVEAGTGVGKSFAYLAPAILRCLQRGEKVVIATSTIALQEQLILKDIPLLAETLEEWGNGDSATGIRQSEEMNATVPSTPPNAESPAPNAASPPKPVLLPILAKGRGNYLSIRRLSVASTRQGMLPDGDSLASLHQIEDWAYQTQDGTLSTLPVLKRPEVWDHVRSDSDNCMGRKCPKYQKCFYQSARRELEKANLIVCNHALFFADLALRTRHSIQTAAGSNGEPPATSATVKAILPNYDHVIFDEAHGLEDAACEHFGLSLSMPRVLRLLRTLYAPRRRKGYLLERSLQLSNAGSVDRALSIVQQAEHACVEFFEDLLEFWRRSRQGGGRIRQPDLFGNPLTPVMRELAVALRRIRESIEDENERFELGSFAKRASEIADCAAAMVGQTLGTDSTGQSAYAYWVEVEGDAGPATRGALDTDDGDEHAPPVQSGATHSHGGRRRFGPRVTLACAPIEVAALLRRYLFDPGAELREAVVDDGGEDESEESPSPAIAIPFNSNGTAAHALGQATSPAAPPKKLAPKRIGIILTSATLATRTSKNIDDETQNNAKPDAAFAHVIANLGAQGAATLQLGSPFDYRKQAKVIVDLTVPDPKRPGAGSSSEASGANYADALAARVLHHLGSSDGGAFVLFTSFATMNACADRLGATLTKRRWPMLVQGRDGSRQQILKRFLEEENGVLFGAASFWQGVDVRGERLRNVIITRLPFEPPDRPLVQARNERIELTGGNPFMQDSLPRAIIRFKQGFGRLIRSKGDRGQVVVLDPRVVTARYGRMFLDALPKGVPVDILRPDAEESFEVADSDW